MTPYRQNAMKLESARSFLLSPWRALELLLALAVLCLSISAPSLGGQRTAVGGLAACAPLTEAKTVAGLDAFVTVANDVSSWAADAWTLVPPAVQSSALQAYTDAQNGLKTAIALAEDGLAALQNPGSGAAPDWAAITAAVISAVDSLVAEIQSLTTSSPDAVSRALATSAPLVGRVTQLRSAQATIHKFTPTAFR